jgi:hypothetical protein
MPTVKLPRASWDMLLILLEHDVFMHNTQVAILYSEIEDQVYSQEY